MSKKKFIGWTTLSLAGIMTLSSFVAANEANIVAKESVRQLQSEKSARIKSDEGKNIFKSKFYFQNRDVLKSVLGLNDEELKTKLAENDSNAYKLLESHGKVEEYKSAVLKLIKERLDKAVAEGKITQEKSDAMYAKAEDAMKDFNAENGAGMKLDAGDVIDRIEKALDIDFDEARENLGKAREVFGDFIESRKARGDLKQNFELDNADISEILGITEEELKTKLVENNDNIYKILEEVGKVEEYKNAVLKLARETLDKAVAEGKITQESADAIYTKSEEAMNNFNGDDAAMSVRPGADERVFKKESGKDKRKTSDSSQETTVPEATSETSQNHD